MAEVFLNSWKKAVLKVGSALIAPDGQGCRSRYMLPIARFITESRLQGRQVILVSSGAVAAGRGVLHGGEPPKKRSIPEKQALAALGQSQLIAAWSKYFDAPCAQILLTHDDLRNRRRFVNAKNTLAELLKWGALPIINENDSVAVDELKVGDNDNLAAHVAVLAEADLLLILSDIDGLYDKNPREHEDAVLIPKVNGVTAEIRALAGGSGSAVGTGGMVTKLQAADLANRRGVDTIIANGRSNEALQALLDGKVPGTLFERTTNPITARKHWMQHALEAKGKVFVDKGAAQALLRDGASLLPKGVVRVDGDFRHGEAVEVWQGESLLAKGISQYGSDSLELIKGRHSDEIADVLGYSYMDVIIHRGDMVVLQPKKSLGGSLEL